MRKSIKQRLRMSETKVESILLLFIVLSNTAIVTNWYLGQPEKVTSITKDGGETPVKSYAIRGHLDRMILNDETHVAFEGWAFDSRNSELVDEILCRYAGKVIYRSKTDKTRPDLVKVFGDDALMGGFRFVVPLTLFKDKEIDNSKIRFFAVSNGLASELKYPKGFK